MDGAGKLSKPATRGILGRATIPENVGFFGVHLMHFEEIGLNREQKDPNRVGPPCLANIGTTVGATQILTINRSKWKYDEKIFHRSSNSYSTISECQLIFFI